MSWFFLSLLAALGLATSDAVTKKYFSDQSPYMMGLIRLGYALPWLLTALFFIPWIIPDTTFWLCVLIGLPMEALAFYCYMKALKVSPLSLTVPFLAFTPGFIIVTGWIILGEKISPGGLCGIILIIAGAYSLNLSKTEYGLLGPLKAIFKEPGSRLMLFVSFIYAFTSTIGKLAIIHSNPYFFGIIYNVALTMVMIAFIPVAVKAEPLKNMIKKPLIGLILGAIVSIAIFSHMLAISMTNVAYMISLKRTSILFGVLYGALWFKEEKIAEKIMGTIIMLSGVFLIGWAA
ncbi:MAG: EamA family transporter [Deltaproteobacteria bacterium]|nr:EamA family transporter [Deltaproteobacteria bacterium]